MTTTTYRFKATRFQCGCVYATQDQSAVICPTHRRPILEEINATMQSAQVPEIEGLVMTRYDPSRPEMLKNNQSNSLHSTIAVKDSNGDSWVDEDTDQVGLCPACLIDDNVYTQVTFANCECGDIKCSYRWCGRINGLHALWSIHAQGRSEEVIDRQESDIFSYGSYCQQGNSIQSAINEETIRLDRRRQKLLDILIQERKQESGDAGSSPETGPTLPRNGYLIPWLDAPYNRMAECFPGTIQDNIKMELKKILTRLDIIEKLPDVVTNEQA